jgi:hypothetical protein
VQKVTQKDKYGLTNPVLRFIIASLHQLGVKPRDFQVYGAAVDLAFLTEMSNLSPPIIHPPPSPL